MPTRGARSPCAIVLVTLGTALGTASTQDPLAFANRGNRMEGHTRREIGNPAFEVLSFVRGARLATIKPPAVLNVAFYLPRPARVSIVAAELHPLKEYRMRAARVDWSGGWNTFGPWETASVLDRLPVPLANVGVVARVGDEASGSGELVPVAFSAPPRSGQYELQFRVPYELELARFRLETPAKSAIVRSGEVRDVPGDTAASIQFDLSGQPDEFYRLVVDCVFKGRTGGPARSFTFFHKS